MPIVMPNQANYQPNASGWGMGANQRAQQEARARFERDWYAAQAAETQRVRQLEEYRRQYDQWAATRIAELRRHNAGIRDLGETLRRGDSEAAVQFFSAVLYASSAWPQDFPRRVSASYDANLKQLVLDWELPAFEVVPEVKSVRYMPSTDQDKETARSAARMPGDLPGPAGAVRAAGAAGRVRGGRVRGAGFGGGERVRGRPRSGDGEPYGDRAGVGGGGAGGFRPAEPGAGVRGGVSDGAVVGGVVDEAGPARGGAAGAASGGGEPGGGCRAVRTRRRTCSRWTRSSSRTWSRSCSGRADCRP
ncbi:hypothetical protein ACU686_06480 [Yinghuangia aomiensis]